MPAINRAVLSSLLLSAAFAAPLAQVIETVAVTSVVWVTADAAAPAPATTNIVVPTAAPVSSSTAQEPTAAAVAGTGSSAAQIPKVQTGRYGKRGLAYNDASLTEPFLSSSKVSWAYDWGSGSQSLTSELEFVPMLWGSASTSSWSSDATSALASGSRHLLGFNEPDNTAQSNLSPQEAASLWATNMEPFHDQAWLGSPAVTNGGAPMGLTWLQSFMDSCTDCNVHFIALHWYASSSDADYFKQYFTQAHQQFPNNPIWITEFGCTDGDDAQVSAFLQEVLPWLDSQDYIHRYAYFMDAEGMLIENGALSQSGQTYAS